MTFTNLGDPPLELSIYPAWKSGLVRTVDQALCMAWSAVVTNHVDAVASKDEDQITDALLDELTRLRRRGDVRGFTDAVFAVPTRDSKLPTRDGTSIDQMPDITIRLAMCRQGVVDDRHDALFLECKVLDGTRGLDAYRVDGIDRFVSGRYAWRMPHAGMLAYVFDRKSDTPTLALSTYAAKTYNGRPIASHIGLTAGPEEIYGATPPLVSEVALTQHDRASSTGVPVSSISLRHMWLKPA